MVSASRSTEMPLAVAPFWVLPGMTPVEQTLSRRIE
jgi:hypothetical protein